MWFETAMGPTQFLIGLLLISSAICQEDDEEVTVEHVKHEDDIVYLTPDHHPDVFFSDHFDHQDIFEKRWIKSKAVKDGVDVAVAKYDGEWQLEALTKNYLVNDLGLVMKSKAKHAAIATRMKKPFVFEDKVLIVQYELNFQNGQDCGGGYIKLLSHKPDMDLAQFHDKTPYSIMFGPDKCGSDAKLHFIFRHTNPKNKSIEEKHCKRLDVKERGILEEAIKDQKTHLYRLILRPDNTYDIYIDYKIVNHGSLFDDFEPPVNPPQEIDDPADFKPEDWDEREKIPDPEAKKPEDWDETQPRQIRDESAVMPEGWLEDEPQEIPDPDADKPSDWDEEMDGEWEAGLVENPKCASAPGCGKWHTPMIDNPLHKGKWHAPLINNPNYKGKWKPRKIPNPDYFFDPEPFRMTPIGGIGIELWSMSNDIYFDNMIITDSLDIANNWAKDTYDLKVQKLDVNDAGLFKRILTYSNRNPWLYAVYVVVVGLPLVLIVTFCCSGDGKKKKDDPKKTDEVQDDDGAAEDEEEQEEEPEEAVVEEEEAEPVKKEPAAAARRRKARKE